MDDYIAVGDETEVVQKEMYTFEDRGGRSLTLRPEGTGENEMEDGRYLETPQYIETLPRRGYRWL